MPRRTGHQRNGRLYLVGTSPTLTAAAPARADATSPAAAGSKSIAVAIHGIEPATFERCALIRDWLADHGIGRATLLVIPARDMHPVGGRSPEMVQWLCERRRMGDAIAQHGFRHRHASRGRSPALMLLGGRGRTGEFRGLDPLETRRAVHAGWRVLKIAGIEPDGFVAPSYAYTPALREALAGRFRWWAELLRIRHGGEGGDAPAGALSPAWSVASAGPLGRVLSPALMRACARFPTDSLRLDVHPADLRHPRHMMALESVLARAAPGRASVTYQDLAGG